MCYLSDVTHFFSWKYIYFHLCLMSMYVCMYLSIYYAINLIKQQISYQIYLVISPSKYICRLGRCHSKKCLHSKVTSRTIQKPRVLFLSRRFFQLHHMKHAYSEFKWSFLLWLTYPTAIREVLTLLDRNEHGTLQGKLASKFGSQAGGDTY